jgi:hypothetical protein
MLAQNAGKTVHEKHSFAAWQKSISEYYYALRQRSGR